MTRQDKQQQEITQEAKMVIKWGTLLIMGIIAFVVLLGSWYTIDSGERGVVLTWGRANPTPASEGLHFKLPIAQSVIKYDIRTQKYEADASAASKDLQTVATKVAVNYHLSSERVVEIYNTLGVEFNDRVIVPSVQEVVKAATATFTAEELITQRPLVKEQIVQQLRERLNPKGILIEDISMTDFDFSEGFNKAIELKVTIEQEALAAQNQLEKIKIEAEQQVTQARAQADSQLALARADAEGRLARAQSEAEALRLQKQSLTPELVQLRAIDKWDGKLPMFTFGSDGGSSTFVHLNPTEMVAAVQQTGGLK